MDATADTTTTGWDRLAAALTDPDHLFTPDQVAYLMATAGRWAQEAAGVESPEMTYAAGYQAGYRARCAEENAAYPPPPILVISDSAGHKVWMDQVEHRRRFDREALTSGYQGGPVPTPDDEGN
jgi:hypothetical protein